MIFYNFIKNIDLKVSAEAEGFNPMIQTIKNMSVTKKSAAIYFHIFA
jgi:competence protein ComGF